MHFAENDKEGCVWLGEGPQEKWGPALESTRAIVRLGPKSSNWISSKHSSPALANGLGHQGSSSGVHAWVGDLWRAEGR